MDLSAQRHAISYFSSRHLIYDVLRRYSCCCFSSSSIQWTMFVNVVDSLHGLVFITQSHVCSLDVVQFCGNRMEDRQRVGGRMRICGNMVTLSGTWVYLRWCCPDPIWARLYILWPCLGYSKRPLLGNNLQGNCVMVALSNWIFATIELILKVPRIG